MNTASSHSASTWKLPPARSMSSWLVDHKGLLDSQWGFLVRVYGI